jgi:hypothetical protein
VVRWGGFSGRLRFRCRGCSRTFSDLTGTPAAYLKKIEALPAYAGSLASTLSVRTAARIASVAPSTAFRWRHRLLDGLVRGEEERLSGWVELASSRFSRSFKGQRELPRRARRRGAWPMPSDPVVVVFALDRKARAATVVVPKRTLGAKDLSEALGPRVDPRATLLGREGRYGAIGLFASGTGRRFLDVRYGRHRSLPDVDGAVAYSHDFRRWVRRFRGVATRYLPNYLAWHRAAELGARFGLERRAFRWFEDGSPAPTIPENRTVGGGRPGRSPPPS